VSNSVEVFSVEALNIRLSSHIRNLLAEITLVISMSAIIRTPEFVIRSFSCRRISTLALRLVELCKIDINDSSLWFFVTFFFFSFIVGVHSVNDKLLRCASRLSNNVFDVHRLVCNFNTFPSLAIIPCEFESVSCFTRLGCNN